MRLTHLGHACLLVETDGARLLFDPGVLSAFDDVRDLDAVLVTHQHADHLDPARLGPLLAANPGATRWVDADTVTAVPGLPDHRVSRPGDSFAVSGGDVDVLAVPVHEGETTDPAKYAGMLAAFSAEGVVRALPRAQAVTA